MLQVQNLHKSYGPATVLAGASLIVNDGEHVGLIGPNGAGKSTLLRCLIGQEQPDSGSIVRTPAGLSIGYLAQAFDDMGGATLGVVVAAAQADLSAAEQALQQAADTLASATDMEAALAAYDAALAHFEALGGYEREHRATAVLQGLGLGGIDPATPATTLSGGQKTRLGLATLLLREPRLLLLDEPTNHLDVAALEWLESFVQSYPHAALIVSHDREFLDQTVTRILYLDPNTRTIKSYTGNYSDFAAAREQERSTQEAAWQDQQLYIQQVEADIRRVRGQATNIQNGPKRQRDYYGRVSAKVARQANARERKLERYLEADERVERPRGSWSLKLDFGEPPPSGRAVLRVEELGFSYERPSEKGKFEGIAPSRSPSHQQSPATDKGEFEGGAPSKSPSHQGSHLEIDDDNDQSLISNLQSPLLSDVNFEVAYGERVALVGPNGAGKTTLLRLIEGRLQPQAGSIRLGANVRVGRLAQEHETLDLDRSVLETVLRERPMSETEARSFLHFFLFGGDSVFRRVGACSLGERSRLQLALLVLRGCNLLLLDEPLNHLDIDGREHFAAALDAFEGTVIAVAHDRAFLRDFAERVIEVREGHARVFAGDYEYYLGKRET